MKRSRHMSSLAPVLSLALLLASGLPGAAAAAASHATVPPPATPKKPVTDEYHGAKVTEDYRWLEDWSEPAVKAWSEEQNRHARSILDHLPAVEPLRKRVEVLERSTSPDYGSLTYKDGRLFAMKFQPPKQQSFLVSLRSPNDPRSEHVVMDPNKLNAKGTTAIDFYVPSRDGRLVAVSLSDQGSENGTVHVYDVASGKALPDVIPRVNGGTAGGSLAWNADGTGFYYTRYPRGQERPAADLDFYQQVYFHKLGTPTEQDAYSVGKDFPRIAEIALTSSEDGRFVLANVSNGDGGEHAFYLLDGSSGRWPQISNFADRVVGARFAPDDALYLLSRADAPRGKILRLPPSRTQLSDATTVVPQSEAAIQDCLPTASRLYVHDLIGGPAQLRVFDLQGHPQGKVGLPAIASVGEMLKLDGDDLLYRGQTYLNPPAWFVYLPRSGRVARTALYRTSPADFSDCEVVREFATSKDGTRIPINIIRRRGTRLDGQNPTLLTAYGGYGLSQVPGFSSTRRAWIEQGGVYAVANIRGGGEYGDQWHTEGNLTHKQKDYDDFAACSKHLIDAGYTTPHKLAIQGGSNGGLLMGAALTQHPELYRAVVAQVGIYDMLRVELSPNGAFNVTEYGTVKNPEQFKALYAYSPYHHVKDGTPYPSVLFTTGANDPRVDPANSRKMAARLQAATSSKNPILLRTSSDAGHGIGSSLNQRIGLSVDTYAFLFNELGVKYKPVTERLHPEEKGRTSSVAPGAR